MKFSLLVVSFPVASVFSFSSFSPVAKQPAARTSTTQLYQFATASQGLIDVADIWSPRDVHSMEQWAVQCGMQKANGVELYSEDGVDYSLMTQSGVGAGQPVVSVPAQIVINSASIEQEFGQGCMQQAEQVLLRVDEDARRKGEESSSHYRLPLFRLMVKILAEWEKGEQSMFYPWLNSLPRQFFNGVSMTRECTDCLPPYAGWLTFNERHNYEHFDTALRKGHVPLSQDTIRDTEAIKWAYNVALTRFHEVWQPERNKVVAPMADMLNHAAEPNCQINFDQSGNCQVTALYDIPAGSPLTVSLGDPTNPTPIFAQYGFLPSDCATIFCKAIHLEKQIRELGYEFNELLFQTQSGEIAPKVWDIFLYDLLLKNDPGSAQQFRSACQSNDEQSKQSYHDQYFTYTLAALKEHVHSIMRDAQDLTAKAQSYDLNTHPRVPVIVAHNQLVFQTFTMTSALLDQMG
ncbi:MAG: hypothetical protein SGARI_002872 [Bacillariaceae sp.]